MHTPSATAGGLSDGGGPDLLPGDYRAVFQALSTPTLIIDPPDFIMVAANAARFRATNTRAEDVIGRRLFDVFPDNPDDPQATGVNNLMASLDRVMTTRQPDVMPIQKYDIPRPEGGFEERWWTPINIPVLGPDGSVRHIIHQVEDVTAEMRERRRAAQAEAGAARFREVADAIPGLVFETDLEARNTYVNDQYLAYTGLPFEALLCEGWQQAMHPDDRAEIVEGWREALRVGLPFEGETRIRRADGAWRWFMVRATPLMGAHGRVQRGIGVCTDIDDAKRGEAALRELHELQHTLLEEVSHRVKNNLTLISSLLRLQARSAGGDAQSALEDAALRVHAVARVHDQLWRRGAGANEIDLRAFLCDLSATVATSSSSHRITCDIEDATVSSEVAAPLGVLVNELLTNAFKYAYPEGAEGEVLLRGRREAGARYRLEVRDFGRGLPADFDMVKAEKSLGMRMITSLANQLRAELRAESGDPGARFSLVLPPEGG